MVTSRLSPGIFRLPICHYWITSLSKSDLYALPILRLMNGGTITTKGDIAQHTDLARAGYGVDGKGIKVGVLSDSYNVQPGNPALANILNGDLPNVRVLQEGRRH